MSKNDDLISKYCPKGVVYKPIWELTTWDKKFNGVDKFMQPKVIKYPYLLAADMNSLESDNGNVRLLSTGTGNIKYTTEDLAGDNLCEGEIVAIPWGGTPNVKYYKGKFVTADNRIATSNDTNILSNKFLYYYLCANLDLITSFYRGAGIKHPSMKSVLSMQIPVPPLPVQEEIVRILDSFTMLEAELEAELEARKKQYEHYRNNLLNFDDVSQGNVRLMTLGDVCEIQNGFAFKSALFKQSGLPILRISNIQQSGLTIDNLEYFDKNDYNVNLEQFKVYPQDVVIALSGATTGKSGKNNTDMVFYLNQRVAKFIPRSEMLNNGYLYHIIQNKTKDFLQMAGGGAQPNLSTEQLKKIIIPVPPLAEQERIVSILDKFDTLVNDISDGLPAEIDARRKQYEYYRDKLLDFHPIAD